MQNNVLQLQKAGIQIMQSSYNIYADCNIHVVNHGHAFTEKYNSIWMNKWNPNDEYNPLSSRLLFQVCIV